ncbi:MAG: CPA2 family monovalent cation:H+ antiporter-2 [Candidatus Omnitrophota bacterium]|jgi:CPA2 family monovalent cation:H+ antiporter-2
MESSFYSELLIVLVTAVIIALTFERLKLPSILGFLIAGVIIGPGGLKLIQNDAHMHLLAETGLIFLMLTTGLELSFERIKGLKYVTLIGGTLQITISIALGILFTHLLGWTYGEGFIFGAVISLSSTALVLKHLIDRGEIESIHGRLALSFLIMQDLAFLPHLIVVNSLGSQTIQQGSNLFKEAAISIIMLILMFGLVSVLLKSFLNWVAHTKNREIFLLTSIVLCFGCAWIGSYFGLSMAIGAFIMGLLFANTDYRYQIAGEIVPFRFVFSSLFFVSLGLLIDPAVILHEFPKVASITVSIILLNTTITAIMVLVFGYSLRIALTTGLILSQVGEFSFLLLEAGLQGGVLSSVKYQWLLCASFLSMLLTPFAFKAIPSIMSLSIRASSTLKKARPSKILPSDNYRNHIILCGFGHVGQDIALGLQSQKIKFVIIDSNPVNINAARKLGFEAIYGDAANDEVLKHARISKAKALVISFGDSIGLFHLVKTIRSINKNITLITRARFENSAAQLYHLGVDMVALEELEVSVELNQLLLNHLGAPVEEINQHLKQIHVRKELNIEKSIFGDISNQE